MKAHPISQYCGSLMKLLLTLLLTIVASVNATAETLQKIPREFQGEWNMRLVDCGSALNDSLLELRSNKISYYESSGPVRAIVKRGRELALLAEVSGEGQTRVHAAHFRLSRDGRTLTDELSTPPFVRYRCPPRRR